MEQTESRINLHDFPPHKRQCTRDLVDRISDLPDFILSVILSFLPTKEAVATVLLSRRWNFLWRTVHNLDFCQARCRKKKDTKFIEFVNRVLHLHDAGLLNKFSLSWNCCHVSYHMNSWINTAITKKVHNLSLSGYDPYQFDLRHLPESVFRCDSLRSLKVINTVVCVSDSLDVCLPKLESLEFENVRFDSEEACENLISGCLILKNLSLEIAYDRRIDFKCRISSPSLRRLVMYFNQKHSLKLNAASLEYLHLGGSICEIIIESSLSSLAEVILDVSVHNNDDEEEEGISYNSIVEAIRAFGCAKVLTLTSDASKALERATISRSFEFKRLVKLVYIPCGSLQDFICSSNNLEVLELYKEFCYNPSKWISFVEVPRCFLNSLKKVMLDFFTYGEHDYEMIRLILEHGSRLEVVEIRCWGKINVVLLRERFKLTQKILDFPRKSPACRVRITESNPPYGW